MYESGHVLLAQDYLDAKTMQAVIPSPVGWWVSEKLDGYRAVWTGSHFESRNGFQFMMPEFLHQCMPANVVLDGEFWMGHNRFESCGMFLKNNAADTLENWENDDKWRHVTYQVFDIPTYGHLPFEDRMQELMRLVEHCNRSCHTRPLMVFVPQLKIESVPHLQRYFEHVLHLGGEGVMLRKPSSVYEPYRSNTLLKWKPVFDTVCTITGYNTAPETGVLRSFQCVSAPGQLSAFHKPFAVARLAESTKKQYLRDFPLGTRVVVRYNGTTRSGAPRFPRLVRVASSQA